MKVKIVVHVAEEGGYWAEVPAIPGCASQGDTMPELMNNIRDAIEACLMATPGRLEDGVGKKQVLELVV